jgi:hypothetical protein
VVLPSKMSQVALIIIKQFNINMKNEWKAQISFKEEEIGTQTRI